MIQVKHLLSDKDERVFSIGPDDTVLDAIRAMAERRVGALLVMTGDTLVGIVSERDYARKVILKGRSSAETTVAEIMSSSVISVGPDDSIDHCMVLCTERHIRHLPVLDGSRVIGVLSIGDLVKSVISEQAEQLRQLQQYIAG